MTKPSTTPSAKEEDDYRVLSLNGRRERGEGSGVNERTPLVTHPAEQEEGSSENWDILNDGADGETRSRDRNDDDQTYTFNFRRFLKFVGPGLLVSIAYLDPGNIESDLQAGNAVGYKLLWVLFWSTVLGLLTQRIVARLGVVTGFQLSELCYKLYPKFPRLLLWIMMEIAIIGSDIQEVIGTAISFYLLSNKAIPIYGGVLITLVDTFTFLFLETYGLRKLEMFFGFLIAVMAASFGYEYIASSPDQLAVAEGIVMPTCTGCPQREAILQGVAIVGACIMPHNLYLHSALVKYREVDRTKPGQVKEANFYYLLETSFALLISFFINLFVLSVFAEGLHGKTNADVNALCVASNFTDSDIFPNNNYTVEANIYKGGVYLGCAYGKAALYIWAIGIFAAGQSSTMTGTYSGQLIMEGFLNLQWAKWKRVLVTRSVAILPTLFIAVFRGIQDLTELNDLMNVLMTIQLPFALIPALSFTNSRHIMGDFRNGRFSKFILSILSAAVIAINFFFVGSFIWQYLAHKWYTYVCCAIVVALYTAFVGYLIMYQLALDEYNFAVKLVMQPEVITELKGLSVANGSFRPYSVEEDGPDC